MAYDPTPITEIDIITGGAKVSVLDKIEFNDNYKIQKITAYKG